MSLLRTTMIMILVGWCLYIHGGAGDNNRHGSSTFLSPQHAIPNFAFPTPRQKPPHATCTLADCGRDLALPLGPISTPASPHQIYTSFSSATYFHRSITPHRSRPAALKTQMADWQKDFVAVMKE
ncbi:hypothetical protein EX30DRAFT_233030 [Ascodesmis nigricans]|uniref:Secreted protein n=1 Tax=Ascodesmis nigricans TaxID=341454 RepID=A0A4S2MYF5_9PEZI|nr:hypothetical protein EX30DRAFT_233030 [Ascodesmis nigricans]